MAGRPLSDALMWGVMIDDRTIVTKAGEFMTCLRYVPPDRESITPAHSMAVRATINNAMLQFGSGWAFWFEDACDESTDYETSDHFPDPVSRAVDEKRRETFTSPGGQLASTYTLSVLYAPPTDAIAKLVAAFDDPGSEDRYHRQLRYFRDTVADLQAHLADVLPSCDPLAGDDLVTYLHSRISTDNRPLRMPTVPAFLSEYVTDDTYVSGMRPRLGPRHIRTIRIKDQPESMTPGRLAELAAVGFPYAHVARWLPLSREDAEARLTARRESWYDARLGVVTKAIAEFFPRMDVSRKENPAAVANAIGANEALALLSEGKCSYGMWSHTVTLTHENLETLNDRIRIIRQIFSGFATSVAEDDDTWLGSIPGHPRAGLDRFLGPSIVFAEILPSSAPWAGPKRDEHLDGPPLLRCMSDGGKAFRLCLHQEGSDLGHVLVLGESGGGKSTLLKSMVVAHRKYKGSRVFYIDRGAVSKLCTLALGGSFHPLAAGHSGVSLQPLAFIDDPKELAWAFEFILGCLRKQSVEANASQKLEITHALRSLATRPQAIRTLTSLRHAVQDEAVRDALSVFCHGGACGDLLDNDHHSVGVGADVVCFEMDRLLQNETALAPVLACIFHEIARTHDDARPTLVVVDECKEFITHPLIAREVDELIRRSRRERMHVVLATHSMLDIEGSPVAHIIDSSVKTKIFTANASARERAVAAALERHGLSPTQVEIIANLRPKREYVMKTDQHWRKFELALSDYEKAIVCGGSGNESKIIDRIMDAGPREQFADRWLEYCGIGTGGKQWKQAAE